MAEDQAALVENIYDLTMVVNHADSLVSRMEGHIGRIGLPPFHTEREIETIARRIVAIGARLHEANERTTRTTRTEAK